MWHRVSAQIVSFLLSSNLLSSTPRPERIIPDASPSPSPSPEPLDIFTDILEQLTPDHRSPSPSAPSLLLSPSVSPLKDPTKILPPAPINSRPPFPSTHPKEQPASPSLPTPTPPSQCQSASDCCYTSKHEDRYCACLDDRKFQ